MKNGDYQATPFPGSQAGYDAAITYCGSDGMVAVGPGADSVTLGTIPAGVIVFVYDNNGYHIAGSTARINLRDATTDANGVTDPVLYTDKTLDLSTATSGQACKSVDVVTRFTNTTAFTNLSLNGIHAINRYGASGSGGGDVATGMGVGAYSEHRGDSAITGSLYGSESATTMYNTGSVVNAFGSLNTAQVTSGATATITTARGIQGLSRVAGSGTGTIATAVGVEGVAGMQNTAAGTITDAIGGRFNCIKDGSVSGTITNAYGIKIDTVNQGGTNNFGLRITGAPSGGSNLNQAIRVDAGACYFGGSVAIGAGTPITKVLAAGATLNFDLTALTVQDLTITVTGAADGDVVALGVPNAAITTTVQYTAWVSAANTVTVRARTAAAGENPGSGTFRAMVYQF